MSTTIYFLRHGKTAVNPNTPISQWILSEEGLRQAATVTDNLNFQDVDVIVASGEEKAFQTVKALAEKLGKEVVRIHELGELDRDKGGHMGMEEYERTTQACFVHPTESIRNWETAEHALNRFSDAVERIKAEYTDKKVLICGHGHTFNLYFAKLLDQIDRVYERMKTNTAGDWGIVKDDKVLKDLGK